MSLVDSSYSHWTSIIVLEPQVRNLSPTCARTCCLPPGHRQLSEHSVAEIFNYCGHQVGMRARALDGDRRLRKRSFALRERDQDYAIDAEYKLAIEKRNRLAIHPLGGQKDMVKDFRCPIQRVAHEAVVDDVSFLVGVDGIEIMLERLACV
ncbi:hypothetical protein EI94DRAFT_22303 [Lactarius quietus]|nr:hypothetical protein EI94DRAFT_22303 [Lactarius quietus]